MVEKMRTLDEIIKDILENFEGCKDDFKLQTFDDVHLYWCLLELEDYYKAN